MEKSNLIKLLSNYGSRLWSLTSVFIFIPLYIKFLGTESYGLISFYALLLGIIGFADAGMSSAVIKELSNSNDTNYRYSVFKNLEKIYLIVCAVVIFLIIICASFIADFWIKTDGINRSDLINNIYLIGFGVSLQLLTSLYFGALFALNSQVKSNMTQLLWSFAKSALVFILFIIFTKSIEIYFIWQIVCNLVYILVLRFFIIKQLKREAEGLPLRLIFEKLPKHIVVYLKGMVFIALISSINIQADKLITSSLFNLNIFGFYNLASSLSQIPIIIATPLVAFAFPLFSKYSDIKDNNHKVTTLLIFNKVFYLINILITVLVICIMFYTKEILYLWTKNSIPPTVFPSIVFDIRMLILGTFFLALQFPFYYMLLAQGKTKYTIYQGVLQLIIGLPLLYFFTVKFGLYGVPWPWLIINLSSFIYLFYIVSKNFVVFGTKKFYTRIFFSPIIITALINIGFFTLYKYSEKHFIPFAILSSFVSLMISLIYFNLKHKYRPFEFKHLYNFPS